MDSTVYPSVAQSPEYACRRTPLLILIHTHRAWCTWYWGGEDASLGCRVANHAVGNRLLLNAPCDPKELSLMAVQCKRGALPWHTIQALLLPAVGYRATCQWHHIGLVSPVKRQPFKCPQVKDNNLLHHCMHRMGGWDVQVGDQGKQCHCTELILLVTE